MVDMMVKRDDGSEEKDVWSMKRWSIEFKIEL